jgi:hypothetical protein
MQDEVEKIIARGIHATELLRNETFNTVVKDLKLSNYEQWLASDSPAFRENLFHRAVALDDIVDVLMAQVSAGNYQQQLLNEENEQSEEIDDDV